MSDSACPPTKTALMRRREALGLTLAEMAALLGLPKSSLQSYESGRKIPRPAAMREICRRTGLTPNDFYPEVAG